MKKKKIIFFCFFVLQQNITLAQKYILKSQNIHQEDSDEEDFFFEDDSLLHFDLVFDKIKIIRNKIYNYGTFLKKHDFYKTNIILLSKYYLKKIKECSNDDKKKKIIKKYYQKLNRIKKNKNYKNLLQYIGVEQEFFDIDKDQLDFKKKLKANGYFDATVDVKTNIEGNFISVDYIIKKNKKYTIRSYTVDDSIDFFPKIDHSFFKIGDGFCEKNFILERNLIYESLKNSGCVFFKNQYINFFLTKDTKEKALDVNLKFLVEDEKSLKPFKFDTIKVKIEDKKSDRAKIYNLENISFVNTKNFRRNIIYKKIPFKTGQLYTLQQEEILYKKILQTEIFKNAYVTYKLDDQQKLATTIHLSPNKKIKNFTDIGLSKKLQHSYEIINPYVTQTLSVKNFFKLLETTNFSLSFLENIGWDRGLIFSPELRPEFSISFPYLFPWMIFYKKENENIDTSTEISIKGKNIFKERTFITYFIEKEEVLLNSLKTSLAYSVNYKNQFLNFAITPVEIFSHKSAKRKFIEKFFLTKLKLLYNIEFDQDDGYEKNSSFINNVFEFGLYKKKIDNNFFRNQYIKNVFSVKKTFPIKDDWRWVSRIVLGTIFIFKNLQDHKHQGIPNKIFFGVGGRATVRGFDFDTLGPGKRKFYTAKKEGEIMFVLNNEVRKNLSKIIELAAFIDLGNTWKVNSQHEIEKFGSTFFKEFAISYGIGLRLNFKLIVASFDLEFPMYHPATGFLSDKFCFHFGLNYPF